MTEWVDQTYTDPVGRYALHGLLAADLGSVAVQK